MEMYSRKSRQQGAKVKGWVGPGSIPVRARDVRDIRDGTWSGMRRPRPRSGDPLRTRAKAWPASIQVLMVLASIILIVGMAGLLAYLLRDRSADINPGAVRASACETTAEGVLYAGGIDGSVVDDYMDIETIKKLTVTVEVVDGGEVVAKSSFDIVPPRGFSARGQSPLRTPRSGRRQSREYDMHSLAGCAQVAPLSGSERGRRS